MSRDSRRQFDVVLNCTIFTQFVWEDENQKFYCEKKRTNFFLAHNRTARHRTGNIRSTISTHAHQQPSLLSSYPTGSDQFSISVCLFVFFCVLTLCCSLLCCVPRLRLRLFTTMGAGASANADGSFSDQEDVIQSLGHIRDTIQQLHNAHALERDIMEQSNLQDNSELEQYRVVTAGGLLAFLRNIFVISSDQMIGRTMTTLLDHHCFYHHHHHHHHCSQRSFSARALYCCTSQSFD